MNAAAGEGLGPAPWLGLLVVADGTGDGRGVVVDPPWGAGAGVCRGFDVGCGAFVGRGVGFPVGVGVARGVGLAVGFGFGVGFGVAALMTTSDGVTDVFDTVRCPAPEPLVASK